MTNILIQQHSSNPEDPAGTNRRLSMLHRNKELAEHFISRQADKDTLVLILDMECPVAKGIADATTQRTAHDAELIAQVQAEGNIPTVLIGMPRWRAYKMLRLVQRQLHQSDPTDPKESPVVESLRQPAPQGTFHCIAISRGKQLAQFPIL